MKWQAGIVGLAVCCAGLLSGCESDDGDDPVVGQSVIEGYVTEFKGRNVVLRYDRGGSERWISRSLRAICDGVVMPAFAGASGVAVGVKGTDLLTTTDANGFFRLSGVPAGDLRLELSYGGVAAQYPIQVAEKKRVKLQGIRVGTDGQVTVGSVMTMALSVTPVVKPGTVPKSEPVEPSTVTTTPGTGEAPPGTGGATAAIVTGSTGYSGGVQTSTTTTTTTTTTVTTTTVLTRTTITIPSATPVGLRGAWRAD